MRSVSYRLVDLKNVKINLGFQGENEHTTVVFDCKKAFDQYPDAVCSLSVISPHGEKYPAITTREGNYVSWVVTDSDLAYPGDGMLQLTFTQGSVVKKTYKPKTHIDDSIIANGNPPSGVENWLDTANQTLEELPTTAKQYALSALDEMTVDAEELPAGSEPEVEKTVDSDTGAINLNFKIPAGGGGTSDYEDLENKPSIGGVTLNGDTSLHDIGAAAESDIPDVSGFYTKPAGGIPASDLADGVIPDVSGKANLSVVAPAFNQATANDPGSLVTYTDGVVYVLPDGHAAGATWANTTKTATNIAEQQRALKNAIQGKPSDVQINGTSIVNQGIANIPLAGMGTPGALLVDENVSKGLFIDENEQLSISPASANQVKQGSNAWKPLTPYHQEKAAFYGMAKAAGDNTQYQSNNNVGEYTENAKSKIHDMLDAPETVSGSTPSITAKAGVRYICGEVSTLTIVVPASGIIDVVFESGSTATVLTITPPSGQTVTWANGFDPTSIEANTVYELNIMDCKGVACAWT